MLQGHGHPFHPAGVYGLQLCASMVEENRGGHTRVYDLSELVSPDSCDLCASVCDLENVHRPRLPFPGKERSGIAPLLKPNLDKLSQLLTEARNREGLL